MDRYRVLKRFDRHVPGSIVELDDRASASLISSGHIDGRPVRGPDAPGTPLPEDFPGRALLVKKSLQTVEAVAAASDEALLDIKGLGEKTLEAIRSATP